MAGGIRQVEGPRISWSALIPWFHMIAEAATDNLERGR
jgi:hypothetical protein